MDGYKVVGVKENCYLKNDVEIKSITIYCENESPDVVGVQTSSFYVNDFRNFALFTKCSSLGLGDIVVPVKELNGQYETLTNVIVIAKAK